MKLSPTSLSSLPIPFHAVTSSRESPNIWQEECYTRQLMKQPPAPHYVYEQSVSPASHRPSIPHHRTSASILSNVEEVEKILEEEERRKDSRQRSTTARESALLNPPSAKRAKDNSRPKAHFATELMIPDNICQYPTIQTASQLPELPSPIDSLHRSKRQKPRGDSARLSMHVRETTEAKDNLPPVSKQPTATINGASRVRLHRQKKKER